MFEQCKPNDHLLNRYLNVRQHPRFPLEVARANRATGCLPKNKSSLSLACKVKHTYHHCRLTTKTRMSKSLIFALIQLLEDEVWKSAMRSKTFVKEELLFQVSHRCNIYRGNNASSTPSHFSLETCRENSFRREHHAGTYGCFFIKPCVGKHVRYTYTAKNGRRHQKLPTHPRTKTIDDAVDAHASNIASVLESIDLGEPLEGI